MPTSQSIDSIFIGAIEKNAGTEREQFLAEACGEDKEARQVIDRLVNAHFAASPSFLEKPADGVDRGDGANQSLNVDALDAGITATSGPESAVVIGGQSHSVLKSLEKQLGTLPGVTLPGEDADSNLAEKPRSEEIPRRDTNSRYQLHGEIARGGMGAIIKGRDTDLGRDLAVKVLLDSHKAKPEYIQRFVEEAQIGGQLQHPGIVPVYELGQFEDERPFFTMKLVKGKTLASILATRKSPSDDIPKLLGIFEQICQTMAYAHTKGVIHRDLKPANIMVGAFGEVQVMDWGLSKVLQVGGTADEKKSQMKHRDATVIRTRRSDGSDDLSGDVGSDTRHGSVMGTPAYMPPEQALGEVDLLGTQSDVFGLGAILAEVLTGKPPYIAEDSSQVFRMATRGRLEGCFERLDQCAADEELILLARHALAAEVDDRLVDAGALARGIEQYQHGVQEQLRKTEIAKVEAVAREEDQRRRKKLYVAIGGLLLLVASSVAVGYAVVAEKQRTIAAAQSELADRDRRGKEEAEDRLTVETDLRNVAEDAAIREESMRYMSESFRIESDRPRTSVLLAAEAVKLARGLPTKTTLSKAHGRLLKAASELGGAAFFDVSRRVAVPFSNENDQVLIAQDVFEKTQYVKIVKLDARNPSEEWREFQGLTAYPRALSSDKNWAITFDADNKSAEVWRLDWSRASATVHCSLPMVPDDQAGFSFTFSHDAKQLLTVSRDVKIWNLTADSPQSTWKLVARIEAPKFHTARSLISSNGRWAVAYAANGARIADLSSESPPGSVISLEYKSINQSLNAAISQDSKWLALGTNDGALLLDLESEDVKSSALQLPGVGIRDVVFSSDCKSLFTGGGSIRWFRLTDGGPEEEHARFHGDAADVNKLAVTADGRWLASGHSDRVARLWDLRELATKDLPKVEEKSGPYRSCLVLGRLTDAYSPQTLRAHQEQVKDIRFSADGTTLLTGGWDGHVHLWPVGSLGAGTTTTLHGHTEPICCAAFSPDGRFAATGSNDKTVRLWDLKAKSPSESNRVLKGFRDGVHHLHFSLDGRWLVASGGRSGWLPPTHSDVTDILVWDLKKSHLPPRVLSGLSSVVRILKISSDSQWVIAHDQESGDARIWNLLDPEMPALDLEGPLHATFRSDGTSLITGKSPNDGSPGRIEEWDLTKAPLTSKLLHEIDGKVYYIRERSKTLTVLCRNDDFCQMWNFERPVAAEAEGSSWKIPLSWGPFTAPNACVNSSGEYLGVNGQVWDLRNEKAGQQPVVSQLHSTPVSNVAFGDSLYASGAEGGTVRISDLSSANVAESTIELPRGFVVAVAPDDSWVLIAQGKTAQLLRPDLDQLIREAIRVVGRELTAREKMEFHVSEK